MWLFLFQRFSGTKTINMTWKHHLKEMGDIEKGTYSKMKQQFLPNNLPKTFTLFNSTIFFGGEKLAGSKGFQRVEVYTPKISCLRHCPFGRYQYRQVHMSHVTPNRCLIGG